MFPSPPPPSLAPVPCWISSWLARSHGTNNLTIRWQRLALGLSLHCQGRQSGEQCVCLCEAPAACRADTTGARRELIASVCRENPVAQASCIHRLLHFFSSSARRALLIFPLPYPPSPRIALHTHTYGHMCSLMSEADMK